MGKTRSDIPLESTITAEIQRWLKRQPSWWGFKTVGGAQQKRGVPDIVGCWQGVFVAFEVKRPVVGHISDLQAHIIDQINGVGGHAFVVYSVEDVKRAIMSLNADMLVARSFLGGGDV